MDFCIYTLGDGEYENKAGASESDGGHTMERNSYQLTECITMVDNRGFGKMDDHETVEIYAQLGNFLPLNEKVEWKKDFVAMMSKLEDSDLTPNYSDFIVPIFIYSTRKILTQEELSITKKLFKNSRNMSGVYPIVVLTHKLGSSYSERERTFREAGAELVLSVENYTEHDNKKTRERCNDLLAVLENSLNEVKFRLEQNMDPVQDRIQRKKFLLKFAHEFTLAEKEKETEKKAARNEYLRLAAVTWRL